MYKNLILKITFVFFISSMIGNFCKVNIMNKNPLGKYVVKNMKKFPWIDMIVKLFNLSVIICNPQLLAPSKENIQTK